MSSNNYQVEFQKLQEQFLNALRLHPENHFFEKWEKHPLKPNLYVPTHFRIKAYNTSYYSRLVNVISDCLFDLPREMIGQQQLSEMLLEYYLSVSTTGLDLVDTARGFVSFLKKKTFRTPKFLPDLCKLSIQYWDLMFGADEKYVPITTADLSSLDPKHIFLIKSHVYLKSKHSIYDIWSACQHLVKLKNDEEKEEFLKHKKFSSSGQGILILKTGPVYFASLEVPKKLHGFVEKLSTGCSLEESIETGFSEQDGEIDLAFFQTWMAELVQKSGIAHTA